MKNFFKDLKVFYRYDCCIPYSLAFLFVLCIYCLVLVGSSSMDIAYAAIAFFILFTYYLYNLYLYKINKLDALNLDFFIKWLSIKICIWGSFLLVVVVKVL